jgi:hypothetical protein
MDRYKPKRKQRSLYKDSNFQNLFEIRIAVVDVKNANGRTDIHYTNSTCSYLICVVKITALITIIIDNSHIAFM